MRERHYGWSTVVLQVPVVGRAVTRPLSHKRRREQCKAIRRPTHGACDLNSNVSNSDSASVQLCPTAPLPLLEAIVSYSVAELLCTACVCARLQLIHLTPELAPQLAVARQIADVHGVRVVWPDFRNRKA